MPLHAITEKYLDLVLTWRNEPSVRNSMYSSKPITREEHYAWYSRMLQDFTSRWYVHENNTGVLDGVVYFTNYKLKHGNAFWGFYKAPEAPLGAGTNLGLDALDLAFGDLGLHKLNAEVIASNAPSHRYHLKLGFREEGVLRDFHFDGKMYHDVMRYGILKDEWNIRRPVIVERITSFLV